MKIRTLLLTAVSAVGLVACASTPSTGHVPYITGSAPFAQESPLKDGFECVRQDVQVSPVPVRIAVSEIKDRTGKFSYEATQGGTLLTQGATEMVISTLGDLGPNLHLIERFDSRIAESELNLSRQAVIRDFDQVRPGNVGGVIDGTDYYITGAITEVNTNVRSGGAELEISGIGGGTRSYVMDVAVDLRLVRTRDTRVIKTVSKRKQIIGREVRAGVFSFFGDYLVDLNLGSQDSEPMQLGVRSVLQLASLDLVPYAFNAADPQRCSAYAEAAFR